ncbi:MAG: ABC transporter substrate-binding protein [bacterium]|nr:ABC transporter substrate-binding protein [bacterium]
MSYRMTAAILAATLLASLLAGCRPGPALPHADPSPVRGGTLVVAVPADPAGLDPHKAVAAATFQITRNLYETLVQVDPNGELESALALEWEVSPDGLAYTFYLRPGARFHDGRAADAAAVKASFERLLDPATGHPRRKDYAVIGELVIAGEHTLVIRLAEYSAAFLSNLAMGWAAVVPVDAADLFNQPVGSGPFRFVEWRPQQHVKLARFEEYGVDELPYLDEVVFQIIPDGAVQLRHLQAGQVDVITVLPPETADQVRSTPGLKVLSAPMNAVQLLAINNARPPFDDLRVRRALSHLVDRQAVVDGAVWGYGTVIGSHMPPVSPYYEDLTGAYEHDPARARQLLGEAGYPDGFEVTIHLPDAYELHRRAGEIIADQLRAGGIRARLEVVEWGRWLKEIYEQRQYHLTVIGHTGRLDPDPFLNRYVSKSRENYMNYDNPVYDQLIAEAAACTDLARRHQLYSLLQKTLTGDAVAVWLQAPHHVMGAAETVRGWRFFPIDVYDLSTVHKTR